MYGLTVASATFNLNEAGGDAGVYKSDAIDSTILFGCQSNADESGGADADNLFFLAYSDGRGGPVRAL